MVDVDGADRKAQTSAEPEEARRVGSSRGGYDEGSFGQIGHLLDVGGQLLQATRHSHRGGSAISSRVGRASGDDQAASSASHPARRSTSRMSASPISYWRIFISRPVSRKRNWVRGSERRALSTRDMRPGPHNRPAPIRSITTWPGPSKRLI